MHGAWGRMRTSTKCVNKLLDELQLLSACFNADFETVMLRTCNWHLWNVWIKMNKLGTSMKRVNKDELINYNLCLSVLILVFFERGFVGRSRESANGGGSDVLFNSFWNRNFFGSRLASETKKIKSKSRCIRGTYFNLWIVFTNHNLIVLARKTFLLTKLHD